MTEQKKTDQLLRANRNLVLKAKSMQAELHAVLEAIEKVVEASGAVCDHPGDTGPTGYMVPSHAFDELTAVRAAVLAFNAGSAVTGACDG